MTGTVIFVASTRRRGSTSTPAGIWSPPTAATHTMRMLTPDGMLVTIAGTPGIAGHADGDGADARFSGPVGVRVAPDGTILVADTSNDAVRLLTPIGHRRRLAPHRAE